MPLPHLEGRVVYANPLPEGESTWVLSDLDDLEVEPPSDEVSRHLRDNHNRRSNLGKKLFDKYGDADTARVAVAENIYDFYIPVVGDSTLDNYARAKTLYLDYFSFILKSEQKALDTIGIGKPPPARRLMIEFIRCCGENGRSNLGIADVVGWTARTVLDFWHVIKAWASQYLHVIISFSSPFQLKHEEMRDYPADDELQIRRVRHLLPKIYIH